MNLKVGSGVLRSSDRVGRLRLKLKSSGSEPVLGPFRSSTDPNRLGLVRGGSVADQHPAIEKPINHVKDNQNFTANLWSKLKLENIDDVDHIFPFDAFYRNLIIGQIRCSRMSVLGTSIISNFCMHRRGIQNSWNKLLRWYIALHNILFCNDWPLHHTWKQFFLNW